MSSDINTAQTTATDRTQFCTEVFAHLCVGEQTAQPVALTGVRFYRGIPLRDGSQEAHMGDMDGVLEGLRSHRGYTQDVASFIASVNKTHTNAKTNVATQIVIKRMDTSLFGLQKSIGNKPFRAHLQATYGKDWWDTPAKQTRVEAQLCRILLDGLDIYGGAQEATPTPTVVATPAEAAPENPTLESIMASLGITPAAPVVAAPTQTVEASKADLVAAIVSKGVMSEREASALNKDTLATLLG